MATIHYDIWVKDGERYVKVADVKAVCDHLKMQARENAAVLKANEKVWKDAYEELMKSYDTLKAKYADPQTDEESDEEAGVAPLSKVD